VTAGPAPLSSDAAEAAGRAGPVVHAVTSDDTLARDDFPALAAAVMAALGPRGAVHLRGRLLGGRALVGLAGRLAAAQAATGCWLVVNDRLDVALASGARAAQLTSRSISLADARARVAPSSFPLGVSVHAPDEAWLAANQGATWLVAGHVHQTASHPGETGRGEAFISSVVDAAEEAPVIAIGGVRPEHLDALRRAGAHGAAVIRGIWGAADSARAAADYLSAYDVHADS